MEKTAMQTVIEAIEKVTTSSINEYTTLVINTNNLNKLLSQALEQEKQQILDAYWAGINGTMNDWSEAKIEGSFVKGIKVGEGAEYYYSQTYTG